MMDGAVAPLLAGVTVVEISRGVAASHAGRLLSTLGAETVLIEPPDGNPLRREPPFLPPSGEASALFAFLAAGKKSVTCDVETASGRAALSVLLAAADILIHDLRTDERASLDLDEQTLSLRYPKLIDVSVLPFGAVGPKAGWQGEEINLIHASGEGFLLPNGLAAELFPDRPPIKVYGHFAEYQGGVVAALGALSALIGREQGGAESVDVSVQDAALAVGAFALQRLGDGSLEHRHTRSFKYGGVLECADGYVELLTLEERQWRGLVELMGRPDWMLDPALADSLERSRRGAEINRAIRAWALEQQTADVVARAQALGVPMAKYVSPAEVLAGAHERARELFQPVEIPGRGSLPVLSAPLHVDGAALRLRAGPPRLGEHQHLLTARRIRDQPLVAAEAS
ncbi:MULTISPECIES: CoA transferase [Bradyrhizobium]|uniref:CoA transferase n=1 Tax=Bradyrhizobium TaxID=374 RepID=UPI0003FAD7D4|nr:MULTISPECIES: CoA transferase [Bradyrhizobium]QOG22001.1 CoA transferase [Bradyrhizobium sp. SEMIA]UFW48100.1 CoA transferase [Bradyrhizobium arachidis]